ncbi:MAG: ABC transporter ATP-binding protein [Gammaproteobacteria bacterium]|nr:ABC transporter ATP-binding protein [Gammaproteobacteria bacterium]
MILGSTEIVVEIKGVRRCFREGDRARKVLENLDLQVAKGECLALIGRSGSGKSTLLNLISGIDRPTAGEVHINGVNLTALSETELTLFRRRHIGFIYQFFNLIPTLNIEENLLLPLELNQYPVREAGLRVASLLEEIALADRCTAFPDQLSGGEQQRVAIARALAHDPLLVLADEPTGNLDDNTGCSVLNLMQGLLLNAGKTLIVVTHSKQVSRFADRVLTLVDGRLEQLVYTRDE